MPSRTIVITGASDGIGAAAARQFAAAGEHVVIVGRSPEKTARVAGELDLPHHVADFADLSQVRRLAAELDATCPRIDVLANNAGGIFARRELTVDGNERTFQVNHLAGFLLTTLLLPKLVASRAKVIQTSSAAAQTMSRYDPDDLQGERSYSAWRAYGNSKLANLLFTRELHRRHHGHGVSAAAFHPGVVGSNFGTESSWPTRAFYGSALLSRLLLISPARGADTLVWLADGTPGVTWQSGGYYANRRLATTTPLAADAQLAHRLWESSEQLLT